MNAFPSLLDVSLSNVAPRSLATHPLQHSFWSCLTRGALSASSDAVCKIEKTQVKSSLKGSFSNER
jgi:hypothetical protein